MINNKQAALDILWSKIDKRQPNECWVWTDRRGGYKNLYGIVTLEGMIYRADKVLFELYNNKSLSLKDSIRHSCSNLLCCNPTHLFKDSCYFAEVVDTAPKGEINPSSKLTEQDVRKIMEQLHVYTNKELGKKFGVTSSAISSVRRGRYWSHVTGIDPTYRIKAKAKLTKASVQQITTLLGLHSVREIGKMFCVSPRAIRHIRNGTRWSKLTGIKPK